MDSIAARELHGRISDLLYQRERKPLNALSFEIEGLLRTVLPEDEMCDYQNVRSTYFDKSQLEKEIYGTISSRKSNTDNCCSTIKSTENKANVYSNIFNSANTAISSKTTATSSKDTGIFSTERDTNIFANSATRPGRSTQGAENIRVFSIDRAASTNSVSDFTSKESITNDTFQKTKRQKSLSEKIGKLLNDQLNEPLSATDAEHRATGSDDDGMCGRSEIRVVTEEEDGFESVQKSKQNVNEDNKHYATRPTEIQVNADTGYNEVQSAASKVQSLDDAKDIWQRLLANASINNEGNYLDEKTEHNDISTSILKKSEPVNCGATSSNDNVVRERKLSWCSSVDEAEEQKKLLSSKTQENSENSTFHSFAHSQGQGGSGGYFEDIVTAAFEKNQAKIMDNSSEKNKPFNPRPRINSSDSWSCSPARALREKVKESKDLENEWIRRSDENKEMIQEIGSKIREKSPYSKIHDHMFERPKSDNNSDLTSLIGLLADGLKKARGNRDPMVMEAEAICLRVAELEHQQLNLGNSLTVLGDRVKDVVDEGDDAGGE